MYRYATASGNAEPRAASYSTRAVARRVSEQGYCTAHSGLFWPSRLMHVCPAVGPVRATLMVANVEDAPPDERPRPRGEGAAARGPAGVQRQAPILEGLVERLVNPGVTCRAQQWWAICSRP